MLSRKIWKTIVLYDSTLYNKSLIHVEYCGKYYRDCGECRLWIMDIRTIFKILFYIIIKSLIIWQILKLMEYYDCEIENKQHICDTMENFIFGILIVVFSFIFVIYGAIIVKITPLIYLSGAKYIKWRNHVTKEFCLFVLSKRLAQLDHDLLDRRAMLTAIERFL